MVSGRRKEALERAQEGQLWGTAVVLAAQLGEQVGAVLPFVCHFGMMPR